MGEGELPWQKAEEEKSQEENDGGVGNIERWYGSCEELGLSRNVVGAIIWFVGSWLHGKNGPSRGRARILVLVVGSSPENQPASH